MTTSVVLFMAYGYAASPIAIPPAAARAGPPRLCSTRSAPPAPPPHATHRRGGGGGDDGLLLASMSVEERRALVALWKWDYETSKTIHDEDAKAAVFVANWADDQQPWLSMLQPRSWRAGFGAGSTEAVIVTRYELDSSHWRRALVGTCMLHGCGSSTRFPFSLYPARWLSLTATPLLCFPFCFQVSMCSSSIRSSSRRACRRIYVALCTPRSSRHSCSMGSSMRRMSATRITCTTLESEKTRGK